MIEKSLNHWIWNNRIIQNKILKENQVKGREKRWNVLNYRRSFSLSLGFRRTRPDNVVSRRYRWSSCSNPNSLEKPISIHCQIWCCCKFWGFFPLLHWASPRKCPGENNAFLCLFVSLFLSFFLSFFLFSRVLRDTMTRYVGRSPLAFFHFHLIFI